MLSSAEVKNCLKSLLIVFKTLSYVSICPAVNHTTKVSSMSKHLQIMSKSATDNTSSNLISFGIGLDHFNTSALRLAFGKVHAPGAVPINGSC